MTHPDILKIEEKGYFKGESAPKYKCCVCGEGIFQGEDCYMPYDDEIVCENCTVDYMNRFKITA